MGTVLPFEGFLEVLRAKGYAVGLHEHVALAKLLSRWERTSRDELRDALAAFLGLSDGEVDGIRRLFDEVYPRPVPPPPPPPPDDPWSRLRRWSWTLSAAGAMVIVAFALLSLHRRTSAPPPPRGGQVPPTVVTPVIDNVAPLVTFPPPPPPPLPQPPLVPERRFVVLVSSAAFLLALAVAWRQKARRAGRRWLRSAWRAALAAVPGPYHFDLVLRDRSARLPRADLDVAATILGRAYSAEMQTRELDVRKTIRLTLRRGLLPQFVFKPRRMAAPIIVLQDVSQGMELWRRKVDAFLVDLRRQGIVLDRWYFDADPRRLAEKPFGTPLRIDSVLRAVRCPPCSSSAMAPDSPRRSPRAIASGCACWATGRGAPG
jgi:hypothetical protein